MAPRPPNVGGLSATERPLRAARASSLSNSSCRMWPEGSASNNFGCLDHRIGFHTPRQLPRGAKIMRLTEKYWQDKGVNVRSTMWAGPRGGAPFAVACLTLLARHDGPVWPLRLSPKGCMLIEGFPAGQLRQWGQPHFGYNGPAGGAVARRTSLLDWMQSERGLRLSADDRCSADALDAVICMYAAAAVREGRLAMTTPEYAVSEGLIAVHA